MLACVIEFEIEMLDFYKRMIIYFCVAVKKKCRHSAKMTMTSMGTHVLLQEVEVRTLSIIVINKFA